jgi:hsp70-interacting protein
MDGTHYAMHSQVPYPCPLAHIIFKFMIIRALSDSDIAVRRKAAFLLNSLLIPSAPVATTRAPGTRLRGGPAESEPIVHPNSHASMVADPTSTDTAPETLRAVRAHGLLAVIVRELTEPTPYGPDGDEGDGCDADLEEKLMRCVL